MQDLDPSQPFISKDDVPLVAMDSMNDVHFHEIEMLNQLHEKLTRVKPEGGNEEDITRILAAVSDHTIEHFAAEERLMQQVGFPAYPVHKMEHERFLQVLQVEVEHWKAEGDCNRLLQFMNDYWQGWFYQHVSTMDTATAAFASNRSVSHHLAG